MSLNLLVLANPTASWLNMLDAGDASLTVADDLDAIRKAAPDAEVILNGTFGPQAFSAALPLAAKCRWFHSLWTGVDNLMSPEIVAHPAPFTNGRGAFKRSLAEWSIGAMLYFAYDFRRLIRQQEAGVWERYITDEIHGKTLGIIGFGEIGRATAERAKAFGMRVLALRRRPELSEADPLVDATYGFDRINDLMASSDYLQVAAPLTKDTRGMVGAAQIGLMKPTGVIINVGRGAVIDEAALAEALASNRIKGAALDVFSTEPLPAGHAFYKLPNLLLSPHTADQLQDFVRPAMDCFLENLQRYRSGEPLLNIVDKHAGY